MKNVKVVWKQVIIFLLGAVGILAVGAVGLFALRDSLLDERRSMVRQQVELGHRILSQYGDLEASGELTREEAKRRAAETIRDLGIGRPEYFWIINHEPRMVMHPYLPHLEGMHIDEIANPALAGAFSSVVASAESNGSGFASYRWLKPGSSDELVEKVSYVTTYEPWDWILGAGVYVDDVQATFLRMALLMSGVAAAVAGCVFGGSVLVSRSITVPLTRVAAGLQRLSEGDLSVQVPVADRKDELGDLVRAMHVFHASLVERERLAGELEDRNRVLRESEARFRDLAELLPEIVFEVNEADMVTYANRAGLRTFGWPESIERDGRTLFDLFDESDHERLRGNIRRVLAGEALGANEYLARRADGETFSVLVRAVPVVRDGRPVGLRGIMFDISERIAAERREWNLRNEIAHVARLSTMGEMAAGFAHELNQPLAAISNYARGCVLRLESEDMTSEEFRMPLEMIKDEAMRAGEIIRRIRDFVRKRRPERVFFTVDGVITDVVGLLGGEIHQGGMEIVFSMEEGLPNVFGDPISIRQVLLNLVRNAVEVLDAQTGGERRITVSASRAGDRAVEIAVEDSGPGIPVDLRHKVFEPFFSTKDSGTGMGLPICRSIIEAHGGILKIDTPATGGSRFCFHLPTDAGAKKPAV